MKKRNIVFLAATVILAVHSAVLYAAVGCTLNDPDRDVKRIFPDSTGYKTEFITVAETGGAALFQQIENELGDTLKPPYETEDVPYAYYTVLRGKEKIGMIHGVNQKGTYGGMQLILATDLEGKILSFYYQKISSPEASVFKNKKFTDAFVGMWLEDFREGGKAYAVENPSNGQQDDFFATLRGLKKNLILLKHLKGA